MSEMYRPDTLAGYIGQTQLKENIGTLLAAAKRDGRPVDHVLVYGISGGGKTTISRIIHNEMRQVFPNSHLHHVIAPAIASVEDMVQILLKIKEGDVLFIDEGHSLPLKPGEMLYTAMEDREIYITFGSLAVNTLAHKMPRFTVVMATTKNEKVVAPMLRRFTGGAFEIKHYDQKSLETILKNASRQNGITISEEGAAALAKRGRGVPAAALYLLSWASNVARALDTEIDKDLALIACEKVGVDVLGLEDAHREYLKKLYKRGECAGFEAMCRMLGKSHGQVALLEEGLLFQGVVELGDEGRVLTALGKSHLQEVMPELFDHNDNDGKPRIKR
jgi:holliday junction DNA helicase RuvB